METFQSPGIIKVGAPTKDGGATIRFETQELASSEYLKLIEYNNSFGYFLFKPNAFNASDIPTEQAEENRKTQSQRIRATLYVLFKQRKGNPEDWNKFYQVETEKFIDSIKEKIDNHGLHVV